MAKTHKTLQYQPPQTSNGEHLFYHSSPKCSLANQTDLILCYFLSILTSPLPVNFALDPTVEEQTITRFPVYQTPTTLSKLIINKPTQQETIIIRGGFYFLLLLACERERERDP